MLLEIAVGLVVGALARFVFKKDPEPLLGVYTRPGKWFRLKKLLFAAWMRRMQSASPRAEAPGPGCAAISSSPYEEMEAVQPLATDENAIDCMYFNGFDSKGTFVIFRIARRQRRKAEIWLSVNVPGVGFFQSPVHPDTNVYNADKDTFSAGGLKFECLEPMKRWKITFNGLLRKGLSNKWSEESFETVHVQITLMWCAFSDPFDFDNDIHPGCKATAVATEKWSTDFFDRLNKFKRQTHYEQWGELWGSFECEEQPEVDLRLRGNRRHSYGIKDWHSFHRYALSYSCLEDGSTFHVASLSMPDTLTLLQYGYFTLPNTLTFPATFTDMNMVQLGENHNPPKEYKFAFKADGKLYDVQVATEMVLTYYLHEDWRSVVYAHVCSYDVNGIKGYGIFEFLYRNPGGSPIKRQLEYPLLEEPKIGLLDSADDKALALSFSRPGCASSKLVGGKGCQLALLGQLSNPTFSVPKGFCLTLRAFDTQMKRCPEVQQAVIELQNTARNNPNELQSACSAAVNAFKKAPLCAEVSSVLVEHLIQVFGAGFADLPLAVRSSASGEDGTEMSAAGQMETVLGVEGLQQISEAVSRCWSSQFAFPAVSYRRQHGQPIIMSAGVVIQEMVPATAAGVLFTCHPVTCNPGVMVLNANYGLGESIVSGKSDPDEILIARDWKNNLKILKKSVGEKKLQIRMASAGGTEEVIAGDDDARTCCLTDELILRLAAIGVELEQRFSNPRDIEFAVDKKNNIYLLQARPITATEHESENYLMHEFDTAMCLDREWLTTANIQEMMPGAMTPLTISTFMKAIEYSFQHNALGHGVHSRLHQPTKGFPVSHNHGFVNILSTMCTDECNSSIGDKRVLELALLGQPLPDLSQQEVISYNGCSPLWKRMMTAFRIIRHLSRRHDKTSWWAEKLQALTIADHHHLTPAEVYAEISQNLPLIDQMWDQHMHMSSPIWTAFITKIIAKDAPVWSSETFSDVAALLSKCNNVFSADVPAAFQKLTKVIIDTGYKDVFTNMSVEEAVSWLNSAESGPVGNAFAEFMSCHGYRCVREAEMRETSWQSEPSKIVRVLQPMVGQPLKPTATSSEPRHIEHIEAKLSFIGRLILRRMLPKAWKEVSGREFSKSQAIKLTEIFKQAYRKLASMMVKESYLPDDDLIFFLTHREIGQVLEKRSGRLITRAQKRRKLLATQMTLRFPFICVGHVQHIKDVCNGAIDHTSSLKLKGLPVSHGEVRGKARVVTSLEAAAEIQYGEILITPYTDIGWSPYFPMISGLVTEIGSIISHGAVVAREYGLPCVVSVSKATVLFKSGDTVLLNGTTGTLEKVD